MGKFDDANAINAERDAFYEYAYGCATDERVDRKLFIDAIDVNVNYPDSWLNAAKDIMKNTGIFHPCADPETGDLTSWPKPPTRYKGLYRTSPVIHYFDFYRFGIDEENSLWFRTVTNTENDIGRRLSVGW